MKHYVDINSGIGLWQSDWSIRKNMLQVDRMCHVFFSESIWTFETIRDSSDHSIKNMICWTLQHFSRGFKRENLFPVSMKEFQCQMDSSDLFTKIHIFWIHLKLNKFRFRWIQVRNTFSESIWTWIFQMDSGSLLVRNTFSESIWKIQIQMDSNGLLVGATPLADFHVWEFFASAAFFCWFGLVDNRMSSKEATH